MSSCASPGAGPVAEAKEDREASAERRVKLNQLLKRTVDAIYFNASDGWRIVDVHFKGVEDSSRVIYCNNRLTEAVSSRWVEAGDDFREVAEVHAKGV